MEIQSAVCLQLTIKPGQVGQLTKLLNTGGNPNKNDNFFSFDKLDTVHFARWLIAPATDRFPASLIYAANVDGTAEQHLIDLSQKLSTELNQIFIHCLSYTENLENTELVSFLKKHSIKTPAFYVGAPGRTVKQIHQEARLHLAIRDYVKVNGPSWKTQREAFDAIKTKFLIDPNWHWVKEKYALPRGKGLKMIGLILLVTLLLPLILSLVICIHLFYEIPSKPYGIKIDEIPVDRIKELKSQENIIYQNQLSQVYETKPGLRKLFLHLILWATNFGAKNWFVNGQLMGTPTIHFARWVFIDGGKRFVFFSNFDGSYDGYLGDFVDNNGWGLNAIYGAAKGYPKTFFIFGGGSYKLNEFMGWGRLSQVPTNIWYSAYPWYGLEQIISKTKLRVALSSDRELNDQEVKETLERI